MLAWSRDGSKVALDHRLGADKEIWTMDAKALGEVRLEESLIDRYAIPEGGVSELVKFIEELKQFRPATARERSEYAQKYQETLNEAAKRILAQEEDRWSEAYQTALRIRLLLRISRFGQRDLKQQEQTVDFVKRFLKAKLDREMETADVELAMFIARALESTGSRELAARAYKEYAARRSLRVGIRSLQRKPSRCGTLQRGFESVDAQCRVNVRNGGGTGYASAPVVDPVGLHWQSQCDP